MKGVVLMNMKGERIACASPELGISLRSPALGRAMTMSNRSRMRSFEMTTTQGILLLFATCFCLTKLVQARQSEDRALEIIKSNDDKLKDLLSAPQPIQLIASPEVLRGAAEWIRKWVPDRLPDNIDKQLEPQRRHFKNTAPATIRRFHLRTDLGSARIDIYEGAGIQIIWRDENIVLGAQTDRQVRLCMKAVLKDYSSEGRFS